MRKKMYWGIASLILIIGAVGVYFMLQPDPDLEPEKKFIAPSEAELKKTRETKKPPREAKDGFTWEWHADHWHEVPIAQNETTVRPVNDEPSKVEEMAFDNTQSAIPYIPLRIPDYPWLKSDLPDELPVNDPTDAEIQEMSVADLIHLMNLYQKEGWSLYKTDRIAGVRLYNKGVKLSDRLAEITEKSNAEMISRHKDFVSRLPIRLPQTEESPAVIIEVTPSQDDDNEGGKQ